MKKYLAILCTGFLILSCGRKKETTRPTIGSVTESVYASGIIKSYNQYNAYATVSGVIEQIHVEEGDTVDVGTPVITIKNETQKLSMENARLAAEYASVANNRQKIEDALAAVELQRSKLMNDSLLYSRQQQLWNDNVGSKIDLESRELAYRNARTNYNSALVKYDDLKKQVELNAIQARNQAEIANYMAGDFVVKSSVKGTVFSILKEKGEIVGPQTPLAVIGDSRRYLLEMQVDEYDIVRIRKEQKVFVTLDAHKDEVFEAVISRIHPIMNERSRTFTVEAEFVKGPQVLYPNITFEANIVIGKKEKAILIPRNYLVRDSLVINKNGDTIAVKTGMKDYQKVEVLSGIDSEEEIIKP